MPGSDELYNVQILRFQGHRSRDNITLDVRLLPHNLSSVQYKLTNYLTHTPTLLLNCVMWVTPFDVCALR
jgi:hypothetical protein